MNAQQRGWETRKRNEALNRAREELEPLGYVVVSVEEQRRLYEEVSYLQQLVGRVRALVT